MAYAPQFFSIAPGDRVVSAGKTFVVTHILSMESVLATEPGQKEPVRLRIETLKLLEDETEEPAAEPDIEQYSKESWAIAQRRLAIIKPFLEANVRSRCTAEECARKHGVHVATFYRWVRAFEASGKVASLVPDKRGRKQGVRLLSPEQEQIIKAAIDDKYLTKDRGTQQDVVEETFRMCRLAKLPLPNHNTIRARIQSVSESVVLRRRGRKDLARNKFDPILGKFPGADFPLAVVQIDHTPCDIILVDEFTRKPIGRPWLTLAIDVYSRMVVGIYLTFEKPSYLSVGMCISNSICLKGAYLTSLGVGGDWPVWGKPVKIHADNAKEFRGTKLGRAAEQYAIDLQWRPVLRPNYGGHIERLMGTFANEIRKIPGKTFSNTAERKGYDSEREAVMTLREFEAYLVDFIVNKYHVRKHAELGMPPIAMWKRGILGDERTRGVGVMPIPKDPARIRLDFLPFTHRTIQTYGVRKDHIDYYDPVLDPFINSKDEKTGKKRSFLFRYDPSDISSLMFLDPTDDRYIRIPYRDVSHPPISEWELRRAQATLAEEGVKEVDEARLFEATDRLRARVEDAKAATKATRKAQTRMPGLSPKPVVKVERQVPLPGVTKQENLLPIADDIAQKPYGGLFDQPVEPFEAALSR